jgi:hypothetical protein
MEMRDGFKEIVDGWMLITGMDDITDRIERAATWTKENGPLLPDEEATIKLMIECQIVRGGLFGDEEGLPDYDDDSDDPEEDDFDCGLMADGQCTMAGSEDCDFSCPNRDSELFAGSKAWMKAHGSACHKCGAEIEDGEEPGTPRECGKCPVPATSNE